MLKFFRRIRQNMLNEGKTSRYFKYAIGEIILVVIGILIALQINSWNKERIDKKEETQILMNLRSDFQNAIEQLDYLNRIRENYLDATKKLLQISNAERLPERSDLDSLMMLTLYSPTFNDPNGTLQALIASDRIDLIRNNDLKVSLMAWPSESEDMTEGEVMENSVMMDQYYPFLYEKISLAQVFSYFSISDINFERTRTNIGLIPSKFVTSNYDALLKEPKFINTLQMRATLINISKHETTLLIDKANKIIDAINTELDD